MYKKIGRRAICAHLLNITTVVIEVCQFVLECTIILICIFAILLFEIRIWTNVGLLIIHRNRRACGTPGHVVNLGILFGANPEFSVSGGVQGRKAQKICGEKG